MADDDDEFSDESGCGCGCCSIPFYAAIVVLIFYACVWIWRNA